MKFDFHCHTTASDGSLTPLQIMQLANEHGVQMLAITDHDTMDGYHSVQANNPYSHIQLIPAVELSCKFVRTDFGKTNQTPLSVHVVALGFDDAIPALQLLLQQQQVIRYARIDLIANRLQKLGVSGAKAGVQALCRTVTQVGRVHFAQFLIANGKVADAKSAFKKYLSNKKLGDVTSVWPNMADVVATLAIHGARAVLAHPLKYNLTNKRLEELVAVFCDAGGAALEVFGYNQTLAETKMLNALCVKYNLQASGGSDFHHPNAWQKLGGFPLHAEVLAGSVRPLWMEYTANTLLN